MSDRSSTPRVPLLSVAEEADLLDRLLAGDRSAHDDLILRNEGLVHSMARTFLGRGVPLEDLCQEGRIGLTKAAQTWQAGLDARFATYARWWVLQTMMRAIARMGRHVYVGPKMLKTLHRWEEAERRLRAEGRPCDSLSIGVELGIAPKYIKFVLLAWSTRTVSQSDEVEIADRRPPPDLEHQGQLIRLLRQVTELPKREREVLMLRYGLGGRRALLYREIAHDLGISREWARRIGLRGLARLSETMKGGCE